MIYPETYFDKAVDDALEEMSRKENKTMANEFENLKLGTEEFAKAMKESLDKWSKDFEKIGEQMKVDFPFVAYDDMYPEYGGRMRLVYASGRGAWHDVMAVLIAHGYEVTLHTEDATETEKELDHIDKWIIIEFDEEG